MSGVLIDLHMHSNISDGTDDPSGLIRRVREAGIGLFSVTDHDAVKAAKIIPEALEEGDPCFIAGVEFSCGDEEGKYHILGYGFDPDASSVQRIVETGHEYRMYKVQERLRLLKTDYGMEFPEEEIGRLLSMDNPGKPHIANLMVKYHYADSKDQAIRGVLNNLHYPKKNIRPEEAITGIREGGGTAVLAHPSFGDGENYITGEVMERRLRRLTEAGLQGVEAFYSRFSPNLRDEILSLADRYGLYVTAGSDYHGTNKEIRLGQTGFETGMEMPDGMKRFLKDFGPEWLAG